VQAPWPGRSRRRAAAAGLSVLVSVGGGGLIAASRPGSSSDAAWWRWSPKLAPTLFRAREAGQPVDVAVSGVAADSLGAKRIGAIAWDVTQQHVKDALLLPDDAIRAAQRGCGKK
jgi:threonine dehydratase